MALDPQSWWLPLLAGLLVAAGLGWLFVAWLRWRLKPAQMSQDMFLDSASAGIKLETHRIPTRNGRTLHARWLPQAGAERIGIALLMRGRRPVVARRPRIACRRVGGTVARRSQPWWE
jgi:hypothetical protein